MARGGLAVESARNKLQEQMLETSLATRAIQQ